MAVATAINARKNKKENCEASASVPLQQSATKG